MTVFNGFVEIGLLARIKKGKSFCCLIKRKNLVVPCRWMWVQRGSPGYGPLMSS